MVAIAIAGAGSSGMAAAHILQDAGHAVTLFEKSSDVGGRATTRRRAGFIYDPGAQYIKGSSPLSTQLVSARFYVNDLIDIAKPVWIFDARGSITAGDPAQNAEPRWNYRIPSNKGQRRRPYVIMSCVQTQEVESSQSSPR